MSHPGLKQKRTLLLKCGQRSILEQWGCCKPVILILVTRRSPRRSSEQSGTLVSGLVAAVVAWRTRNNFLTIAAGLLVLWIERFLLGL
ncbi:MAG: AzlD domain-containing protein [Desulfovibrionales bacterium]